MLIDAKVLLSYPPPPAYDDPPSFAVATTGVNNIPLSLSSMPPHLLLHIIFFTIPLGDRLSRNALEEQRRALLWLSESLRLVDRAMYISCQHLLRSTYLSLYQSMVKPPFTSDPFPFLSESSTSSVHSPYPRSPLNVLQRETRVLDQYIALRVREDVWRDDSLFHLERVERFKDLFDITQPRARLEDLVREYGSREGIISFPGASPPQYSGSGFKSTAEKKSGQTDSTMPLSSPIPSPSSTSLSSSSAVAFPSSRIRILKSLATPSPSPFRISSFFTKKPPPLHVKPFMVQHITSSVSLPTLKMSHSPTPDPRRSSTSLHPLQFHSITVSFTRNSASLMSSSEGARKTLVRVTRKNQTESLEVTARKLINELQLWAQDHLDEFTT